MEEHAIKCGSANWHMSMGEQWEQDLKYLESMLVLVDA